MALHFTSVKMRRPARASRRVGSLAFRLVCALTLVLAGAFVAAPAAEAAGPDAVMTPTGYNTSSVPRGDDTSNLVVNLPFAMNWNGTNYTQIYINMNGNCTFGAAYNGYNPNIALASTNRNIMAPFWADVDSRNGATSQVTYSTTTAGSVPQVDGRDAFFVNWVDVGRYNTQATPLNSFQLVLVDRSDTGAGNFDFIFNYDQITWDIATAASNYKARAGWGFAGTGTELPGSGVPTGGTSTLLDSSAAGTSLIQNTLNANGQLGRYVFSVRSGQPQNNPPQLTVIDRVLEGNAPNSYVGYAGTGDATAFDPDGSIASLTHDRPAVLPLGITNVTWTATDNRGAVVTAVQTITVADTMAPSNPALSSPSHVTGVWTVDTAVTVDAVGGDDVCTGVNGYSYSWSSGSLQTPDTTPDPTTFNPGTPAQNVTIYQQAFPNATWPADWTRVLLAGTGDPLTYVRSQNTRRRTSYAAEVWANSNTRRTFGFYRDFDLAAYESATLTYWDYTAGLDGGADYALVEYSTDGGGSWITLRTTGGNAGWTERSFPLPTGGTVRVRFSGSVNANNSEYCDWDDIILTGTIPAVAPWYSASNTSSLADGTWFFNLHTGDNAGNWSAPVNIGPFLIDTVAPVTTHNVAPGWSNTPVAVTLTATDAGQVAYTRYSLDGVTWLDYSGPFTASAEGTTTVSFYSADVAGHSEGVKTAIVQIDTVPPTAPGSLWASATSTSSVEITWAAATDAGSGLTNYGVYRDGVLIATTTALTYTDTGLPGGQDYEYHVTAFDAATNESAFEPPVSATVPASAIWLTITETSVDLGTFDPDETVVRTPATEVIVGGIGPLGYTLSCSAVDFQSPSSVIPVSVLGFITHGWVSAPLAPFSTSSTVIGSSTGSPYLWGHHYIFDYTIHVPIQYDPGAYVSYVTYTAITD